MQITIETAQPGDRTEILQLLERSGLPVDGILDHFGTALVARADGRVVGTAALEVYRDGALLRSVAVDEAVRGSGIGHRLTEAALELATQLKIPAVYLLTTTAERYFPKFAFREISRDQVPATVQESVEFRSACPASAIVMRKTLVAPADQTAAG